MEDKTGRIRAICISEKRGTPKYVTDEAELREDYGIVGDAHAGFMHRQVSLLPYEAAEKFREKGARVEDGAFGENILTEGLDLKSLEVGSLIFLGSCVMLEVSQIGKVCHDRCAIYKSMGDCIMPREGIFARVLKGGHIKTGDGIRVEKPDPKRAFTAAVITLSDRAYKGEREDRSGPLAAGLLKESGYEVIEEIILPDEKERLKAELIRLCDMRQVCLIITTGGTGFAPRDITPEATTEVIERGARGIAEAIRAYSLTITKRAMLSRGEAGIRGKSLIVNLPGSPKAVRESLEFILPELGHGIGILRETEGDCGNA